MASGYVRQSAAEIVDGQVIEASDLNNEFNQLQSAFDSTVGHDHSGSTPGTGPKININTSTTGILPVTAGGTGINGGISGGILTFTDTNTIASSNVLGDNQIVLGGGLGDIPSTPVALGTATTVLHGNASGPPSWGSVGLTVDVSGVLPLANGGTGAIAQRAVYTNNPADPTNTTSTSFVMAGLASPITPAATGRLFITICGAMINSTAADGGKVTIAYGTGAAPVNGAAATGTTPGNPIPFANGAAVNLVPVPFSVSKIITGLVVGTAYWVDLQQAAISGGTLAVINVTVNIVEI